MGTYILLLLMADWVILVLMLVLLVTFYGKLDKILSKLPPQPKGTDNG
jgi:hypothetical protein